MTNLGIEILFWTILISYLGLRFSQTIQEINLDKKDLSFNNKLKKIEAYWNSECTEHPSNNHCKIFCD